MMFGAKPLDKLYITQPFGVNHTGQADFYSRFGLKNHNGLDLRANEDLVYAPISGIAYIKADDGYGNSVRIRNQELEVVLGHLKKFKIPNGFQVNSGDAVAISDNTGFSTGPHLHIGVRRLEYRNCAGPFFLDTDNGYDGYIDPMTYFNPDWFLEPIDRGYGVEPVSVIEFAPHFLYFLKRFKRVPTKREYNALRYGRWPLRDVIAGTEIINLYTYPEARAKGLIK